MFVLQRPPTINQRKTAEKQKTTKSRSAATTERCKGPLQLLQVCADCVSVCEKSPVFCHSSNSTGKIAVVDTLYPESLLKVLQSSLRIAFPLWSQTAKMAILTVITPVHCNTVTSKAYNFKKEVQQSDKTFMNSTWR